MRSGVGRIPTVTPPLLWLVNAGNWGNAGRLCSAWTLGFVQLFQFEKEIYNSSAWLREVINVFRMHEKHYLNTPVSSLTFPRHWTVNSITRNWMC